MPVRVIEAAQPAEAGGRKLRIIEAAPAQSKTPEINRARAILDPIGDFVRAVRPAAERVAEGGAGFAGGNLLQAALSAAQGATVDQVTAPVARVMVRAGVPIYERPPAPWDPRFGQAPRRLEGDAAEDAMRDTLNTAVSGIRATGPVRSAPAARVKVTPAQQRVGSVVERAIQRDAMTPQDVIAATEKGVPAYQAGGENLTSVAEVAAQSPGPARRVLRNAVRDYNAEAPKRTKADIGTSLGGRGDYLETLDAAIAARKESANRGIAEIEMQPVKLDENSVLALRSDLAKGAIRERAQNALASPDPEVRASGARLNRLADDLLDNPGSAEISLRDAQDISRSLQQSASAAYRSGDGGRGEALASLGRAVRSNAADPERGGVAGYADWLKKYGDDVSNEEALELGRNVFKSDNTAEAIAKRLKDASDSERDMFRKGVGEAVLYEVRRKGDVGELRQLLKNEEFGDRVAQAFPDDQSFAGFMESAAKRVAQQDRNSQVFGGSPTYARQAARADLEDEGGQVADTVLDVMTGDVRSLGKKAAKAGIKGSRKSVLTDQAMNEMLGRAMADPDELTALLNLLQASRAASASRAAFARQAAVPLLTTTAAKPEG